MGRNCHFLQVGGESDRAPRWHGVTRIGREVHQNGFQLSPVRQHRQQPRLGIDPNGVGGAERVGEHFVQPFEQRGKVN
jgi:hypothetical protein